MSGPEDIALIWLEARGFRAFGSEARRLDLSAQLVVIHAGNSQGKTSFAEAVEFLLTGRSSRRDLFGGAKAEYNGSLRNAHLPEDAEVWVAAGVRDIAGVVHEIRRTLVADFAGAADCTSRLTVDGLEQEDCPDYGLSLGDGVMGAPVLLQHTLRYVLSTEPKQRAAYFKALLTLSDLDLLRQRIAAQRTPFEQTPNGPSISAVRGLGRTSMTAEMTAMLAVDPTSPSAQGDIEAAMLSAGKALVADATTIEGLLTSLERLTAERADRLFPLTAFASVSSLPDLPEGLDTAKYLDALSEVDQTIATLLPTFSALLVAPGYEHINHAVDCPVCASPASLTPKRVAVLRDRLRTGKQLDDVTTDVRRGIRQTRAEWTAWSHAVEKLVPVAGSWDKEAIQAAKVNLLALCGQDKGELQAAVTYTRELNTAKDALILQVKAVDEALAQLDRAIERRVDLEGDLTAQVNQLDQDAEAFGVLRQQEEPIIALRNQVSPALEQMKTNDGIEELVTVINRAPNLVKELRDVAARALLVKRLNSVDRVLKKASSEVLDARFAEMSGTIEKWWSTIRPDELVSFAGVKRRAAGAVFVNLIAALQPQTQADAVERDALGVYSDSQLNALGLSTFLARAQLTGARSVILDDPIPGSDGDHRLTFVQNTLGELLTHGQQVILTTYDPKLAEWAAGSHTDLEPLTFDLNLLDATLGTEPTQTSDPFSRFMLQAEDNLNAPTAGGRRAACNAYRSAAERLAKQVIATNRSAAGISTNVADVEREASQLGDLVPLVRGFALTNDEGGKWTVMPKVLNPGSHDDDVPATLDLKQIRGNLREIAKNHRRKWSDGLVH